MAAPELKAIPIICGPTGSGKTAVALRLAEQLPIEIISADSRQIIKHLDIGTAKPTAAERAKIKFHLIDIIEPGERYTAFRFIDGATRAIESIISNGKIPLIVGGTGLYLRALSEGVVEVEQGDLSVRENLEEEMERLGPDKMHEKLSAIDPDEAARIHPHNRVRVIRALEIYHLTGKPKSKLTANGSYRKSEHDFAYFCLTPPRDELYDAINARVDQMIAAGLLEEVRTLVEKGLKKRIKVANVIGYNEVLDHLYGNLSLDEAVNLIRQNSRRYAKRQMTWFRKQQGCEYFSNRQSLAEAIVSYCQPPTNTG